jgi:hypothetical protein
MPGYQDTMSSAKGSAIRQHGSGTPGCLTAFRLCLHASGNPGSRLTDSLRKDRDLDIRQLHVHWRGWCAITAWTVLLVSPLCLCAQEMESPRFALLIGVDRYANLSPAEQLDGSANDVALIRSVLINRFGFPADNIIQRADEEATGDGIRAAFAELLQRIDQLPTDGPQSQVYFHYSGHGSQVADQPKGHEDRDEPDGYDETLVPHDADRQGGDQDIRDDEINQLINRVVGDESNPRARFILVYDCCHSGSGARGATKTRQLSRPIEPVDPETAALGIRRKRLPPGVVFLSACHETEVEPEFQEDGKTYGLLTRFLSQVLTEHETLSELSYDSLHDAIRSRYQSNRRVVQAPHPQLEASDLGTRRLPFLGATRAIDRPASFPLAGKTSSGGFGLKAGRLHGLNPDALLNVFENPEAAAADRPIGTLRLRSATEFESEGEFVEFDEAKQDYIPSSPPATPLSTAVVSLLADAAPSSQIRIQILKADAPGAEPALVDVDTLPSALGTTLKQLSDSGKISIAADNPDLVLKVNGQASSLLPASGIALHTSSPESTTPEFLRGGWGPFDDQGKDAEGADIGEYINRIVKAQNLVSVAGGTKDNVHADYEIEYRLLKAKINDDGEIISTSEIDPTADKRIVLKIGTVYTVQFRNSPESKGPLYCTALEVTPNMGIQVVAPYVENEIKLFPGESWLCDPFEADTAGELYEILLATQEPHDFSFVEQSELPQTRGSSETGDLQAQLTEALFPGAAKTRGSRLRKRTEVKPAWLTRVIQWEALPEDLAEKASQSSSP